MARSRVVYRIVQKRVVDLNHVQLNISYEINIGQNYELKIENVCKIKFQNILKRNVKSYDMISSDKKFKL